MVIIKSPCVKPLVKHTIDSKQKIENMSYYIVELIY